MNSAISNNENIDPVYFLYVLQKAHKILGIVSHHIILKSWQHSQLNP